MLITSLTRLVVLHFANSFDGVSALRLNATKVSSFPFFFFAIVPSMSQTATIYTKEGAEAWLALQVANQVNKGLPPTYDNFGIVVVSGKVLLRCQTCYKACPSSTLQIVKGVEIDEKFRTHVLQRHFEKKANNKPSSHDEGLQTLRAQQEMEHALVVSSQHSSIGSSVNSMYPLL